MSDEIKRIDRVIADLQRVFDDFSELYAQIDNRILLSSAIKELKECKTEMLIAMDKARELK